MYPAVETITRGLHAAEVEGGPTNDNARTSLKSFAPALDRMLARKPKMLVAIALANKMARAIWAMLTKGEDYNDPALIAAA